MITFLLILIGLSLVIINVKTLKKEKNTFKRTFDDVSSNLKDYDVEIGKLRKEFAETILELQQEIEYLKDNIDNKKVKTYQEDEIDNEYINSDIEESNEKDEFTEELDKQHNGHKLEEQLNSVKINEIKQMMNEGLSIDSISEKLGMGKGEILLIEKLYLK
jgi:uncharacterized small protein (DUF1192 family)